MEAATYMLFRQLFRSLGSSSSALMGSFGGSWLPEAVAGLANQLLDNIPCSNDVQLLNVCGWRREAGLQRTTAAEQGQGAG